MSIERFRKIIGLAGLPKNEDIKAKRVARAFRILMVFIAIWLPLQLYFERKGLISVDLMHMCNWFIWVAFFSESFVLLLMAKRKSEYLLGNWLKLVIIVGSFPPIWEHTLYIAVLRWLQALLVLRLVVPVWDASIAILSRNHLGATLAVFFIVTILWGLIVSIIDPAFNTPWDGIWWAWQTVTTVGYGDIVPQSLWGRILAGVLMVMGLAMISLLTASFSAYFISRGIQPAKTASPQVLRMLEQMQQQLANIQQRLDQQEKNTIVR
jgi:voltage-gated potassium channel